MAKSATTIRWEGKQEMLKRIDQYQAAVRVVVLRLLEYWTAPVEREAKQNAPWKDRSGNARQFLFAQAFAISEDVVSLYLSQKMEYGKWLELAHGGKYQIVMPTLESFYNDIMQSIQDALN